MGSGTGHVGGRSCTNPRKMNQVAFDVIDHAYATANLTSCRYRERGAGVPTITEIRTGADKLGSENFGWWLLDVWVLAVRTLIGPGRLSHRLANPLVRIVLLNLVNKVPFPFVCPQ